MAKKLKVDDVIHGYRITKVFGPGMMAISYAAQGPRGEKVFFKQYKSPAPTVVWYRAFVAYQKELSARVRDGKAAHFAVRQLDAFETRWGGPCYFQTYEFVENGADLQQMMDAERERHRSTKVAPTRDPAVWAQHVTWAKVLMTAIAALHEAKIVPRRPEARERVSHPGSVDRLGLSAEADRHGFLAPRRPPGALARIPGIRRHRQLPLSRAPDARIRPRAPVGCLHLRPDALRAARR
jgi:hypothetical protein